MHRKNPTAKEALEIIFDRMAEKGLVSEEMQNNKEQIIENALDSLHHMDADKEFSLEELKNEKVQQALMGLIISETLGLKQTSKEFIKTLENEKENLTDDPNPELSKKIKHGLILLALFNQIEKSPQPRPDGMSLLKEFEDKLTEKSENKDKKDSISNDIKEYERQISDALRNLYGGDDPRFLGEIPSIILGPIVGNLNGFASQGPSDPNSTALMVEQISYNTAKFDPLGLENLAKEAEVAMGEIPDAVTANLNRPKMTPT